MRILVTGVAGFIGARLAHTLLRRGDEVFGVDNLNDYYDVGLKRARLERLQSAPGFHFVQADIADSVRTQSLFQEASCTRVAHLAAQAGVRYSIDNPLSYGQSNLIGFLNVLEGCRHNGIEHLVYASSSSVYGANETTPFSIHDNVDHPISLYAATKRANEAMAHSYSHLYNLPTTGLRFFTVYGPWGRPDMSPMLFADAITRGKPLKVFNYGRHKRDFTYIDDIVEGVVRCLDRIPEGNPDWCGKNPDPGSSRAPWRLYNIGASQPVELLYYIELLEQALGKRAEKEMLPMQPGDVEQTYADVTALMRDTGYRPTVGIEQGIERFARWYRDYYSH